MKKRRVIIGVMKGFFDPDFPMPALPTPKAEYYIPDHRTPEEQAEDRADEARQLRDWGRGLIEEAGRAPMGRPRGRDALADYARDNAATPITKDQWCRDVCADAARRKLYGVGAASAEALRRRLKPSYPARRKGGG